MRLKSGWETEILTWIRLERERTQVPEIDQTAKGLPGGHRRAKKGSQQNRRQRTAVEPKLKLIHDDPEVRSATSSTQLQEQHKLGELHNDKIQYLRAWDCQVP